MKNIFVTIKEKLEAHKMERTLQKVAKTQDEYLDRVCEAHDEIVGVIRYMVSINDDRLHLFAGSLARLNEETGELVDYLMYFEDYNDMSIIYKCLKAYLVTNEEYLDECLIDDINRILRKFR